MSSRISRSTSLVLSVSLLSQTAFAQSTWNVTQDPTSGQPQASYLDSNGQPTQVSVDTLFSDEQMDRLLKYFDGTMSNLDATLNKTVDGSLSIADRAVTVAEHLSDPKKVAELSFAAAAGGALGAATVNYGLDLLAKGFVYLWREVSGESKKERIQHATQKYETARKAYLDGTEALDALEAILHQSNQLMKITLHGREKNSTVSLSESLKQKITETEDSVLEAERSIKGEQSGLYSDETRIKALRADSRSAQAQLSMLKSATRWVSEELPRACREATHSREKLTSIAEGLQRARREMLENQKLAREGLYRQLRQDDRKLMRNYRSGLYARQSYQMDRNEVGRLRFRSVVLADSTRAEWNEVCHRDHTSGIPSLSLKRARCRKLWNTSLEVQPAALASLRQRWNEYSRFSEKSVARLMLPFAEHRERQTALAVLMREDILSVYQRQIAHLDFLSRIEQEYAGHESNGLSTEMDQFISSCRALGGKP